MVHDVAGVRQPASVEENDGRRGFRIPSVLAVALETATAGHALDGDQQPDVHDFDDTPDTSAPAFDVPVGPFGNPSSGEPLSELPIGISSIMAEHIREVEGLRAKARLAGFPV